MAFKTVYIHHMSLFRMQKLQLTSVQQHLPASGVFRLTKK